MKKFFAVLSVLAALIFFSLSAAAKGNTYESEEYGIKVTYPEQYDVATKYNSQKDYYFNDPSTLFVGKRNKDDVVITVHIQSDDKAVNFSEQTDTSIKRFSDEAAENFREGGTEVEYNGVYMSRTEKYIIMERAYSFFERSSFEIEYYTERNDKIIIFFMSSSKRPTQTEKNELLSLVQSAEYEPLIKTGEMLYDEPDGAYTDENYGTDISPQDDLTDEILFTVLVFILCRLLILLIIGIVFGIRKYNAVKKIKWEAMCNGVMPIGYVMDIIPTPVLEQCRVLCGIRGEFRKYIKRCERYKTVKKGCSYIILKEFKKYGPVIFENFEQTAAAQAVYADPKPPVTCEIKPPLPHIEVNMPIAVKQKRLNSEASVYPSEGYKNLSPKERNGGFNINTSDDMPRRRLMNEDVNNMRGKKPYYPPVNKKKKHRKRGKSGIEIATLIIASVAALAVIAAAVFIIASQLKTGNGGSSSSQKIYSYTYKK